MLPIIIMRNKNRTNMYALISPLTMVVFSVYTCSLINNILPLISKIIVVIVINPLTGGGCCL